MTQTYDSLPAKLDAAIAAFGAKGGKADTIILPPVDMLQLAGDTHLSYDVGGRVAICRYRGVRVMEGNPIDHGYVEGHDYRSQPSMVRI